MDTKINSYDYNAPLLPTDEEISIEAYHRDFFSRAEEDAFKAGCVFMRNKINDNQSKIK
jgi:hypothetical protein